MTKDLYDLTVEEFTRLLLNFEEVYHLELKVAKEDNDTESDTVIGTYGQLCDAVFIHPQLYNYVKQSLFDYNMCLTKLDIYNYIEHKTKGFEPMRVKLIIEEMELVYNIYKEHRQQKALEEYQSKNKEIPYKELPTNDIIHTFKTGEKINKKKPRYAVPDFKKIENSFKLLLDELDYKQTINLLKSKINLVEKKENTTFGLPKELNTPEAKKLLDRAVKYNLLKEEYKWSSKLMTKRELAYLCYVLSNKLELSSIMSKTDDGRNETNWKPFKELFNDNNLNNNLRGITTDDILTNTMDKIKGIYDF